MANPGFVSYTRPLMAVVVPAFEDADKLLYVHTYIYGRKYDCVPIIIAIFAAK